MENKINLGYSVDADSAYVVSRTSAPSKKWQFLNLNYLEKVAPGNVKFFIEIMMVFRTDSLRYLADMKEHLDRRDFVGLSKTAHTMKPTGVYVGVDALTLLMASLEKTALSGNIKEIRQAIVDAHKIVLGVNAEIDEYVAANRK